MDSIIVLVVVVVVSSTTSSLVVVAVVFIRARYDRTYDVDSDDDADDVSCDDVGPVTVVKRVPGETTQN